MGVDVVDESHVEDALLGAREARDDDGGVGGAGQRHHGLHEMLLRRHRHEGHRPHEQEDRHEEHIAQDGEQRGELELVHDLEFKAYGLTTNKGLVRHAIIINC